MEGFIKNKKLLGGIFLKSFFFAGAVVGPTFGCLLGQQFQILKLGDRFWYENNIPPSAFTKGKGLIKYKNLFAKDI